jgi:hypothetical protein
MTRSIGPVSERDEGEKRRKLADAIVVAEEVRTLAAHHAVQEWFKAQDKRLIENVLSAAEGLPRTEAVADVKALRALRSFLAGVETVGRAAERRLNEIHERDKRDAR